MLSTLTTKKGGAGNTRKLWGMMTMSVTLTVVMVSQAYVQAHPTVSTKYVQFFVYQLHLNKAV